MTNPVPVFRRKRYVKKPIPVHADQWFKNGDHPEDGSEHITTASTPQGFLSEGAVVRYFRHPTKKGISPCEKCGVRYHEHGWIDTLEGGHIVCPGDWIITGVAGERYPCKPDIFAASYDEVEPGVELRQDATVTTQVRQGELLGYTSTKLQHEALRQGLPIHVLYRGADVADAVPSAADLKAGSRPVDIPASDLEDGVIGA